MQKFKGFFLLVHMILKQDNPIEKEKLYCEWMHQNTTHRFKLQKVNSIIW